MFIFDSATVIVIGHFASQKVLITILIDFSSIILLFAINYAPKYYYYNIPQKYLRQRINYQIN